jgi:hypothetical protein
MKKYPACSLALWLALFACNDLAYALQGPRGELETPLTRAPRTTPIRKVRITRPPRTAPPKTSPGAAAAAAVECDGEILLRCNVPGCEIYVEGKQREVTDEYGELYLTAPRGTYNLTVSKPGYENAKFPIVLKDCGEAEPKEVRLKGRVLSLKFRTSQPDCEIFINNSPTAAGRSDDKGLFSYQAAPPALLIEARKQGYISANERVNITPELAQKEVNLYLKPIPAMIIVSANIENAQVQFDGQGARRALTEPFSVSPGHHRLTAEALGYAPATLEVSPGPGETVRKSVMLTRLPVASLVEQAETSLKQLAYENVLTLSRYIFEVEAQHPIAHRLAGLAQLARQNYAQAKAHLAQALSGNETVRLLIRRHPREEFDPVKGHDVCEAALILGKSEVEFLGLRAPADNFKVAYDQVRVIGLQLKKNVALYLGTKVTRAPGKRQDFNFYSPDKEVSQSGKAYLEMLQSLLVAH